MNYGSRIAICLAGGLVLQANVHALTPADSPYATIVKRNVFRLTAPLPVAQVVPEVPLPKITLLGIVSGWGPKQVMFKTLAGTPPRETSYALAEKERADEIEVIEISESAGWVRLKNRGREQALSLEKDGMRPDGISAAAVSGVTARPMGVARVTGQNQPRKPTLTAEEQAILMEVNRKLTAEQVEKGLLPPLPPTPLTGN